MPELSVIIPANNEEFVGVTVENILQNIEADTEIIVVLDGYWPDPPLKDHKRVSIIHHTIPIGQRAATNEGAKISNARFLMKIDAHCAVDKGFDRKLIKDFRHRNWTLIPMMHKLSAFEWECSNGHKMGQGTMPSKCEKCESVDIKKDIIWKPRGSPTVSWRFDKNMQFQYWGKRRPRGRILETMSCIGACFFMQRDRFWDLGGMDEKHGSWGQFGTELACKAWLSGGKMMTTKNTWFAHMFRTGNFVGAFKGHGGSFPYVLSNKAIERARKYSRDLWLNNKWPGQIHKIDWLVDRFNPPGW
jgi:glycosyltransferase involved in cell wall biosynthesis